MRCVQYLLLIHKKRSLLIFWICTQWNKELVSSRIFQNGLKAKIKTWYLSIAIPQHYDKKGKLISIILLLRNVTEEKKREFTYQEQLRKSMEQEKRANNAKTDFLRRMSHDIRTPINGIRGMVEISRHYIGNEEKQEDCRNKIMDASRFPFRSGQ